MPEKHQEIWQWLKAFGVDEIDWSSVIESFREKLPWIKHDLDTSRTQVEWFKTLVLSPKRMWWAQQWVMGYPAWALFVGNEGMRLAL